MARTLYHLYFPATGQSKFYGSVKAITDDNTHEVLGVGRDTLYRVDWDKGYSNELITIKKGELITTAEVKDKKALL